MSASREASDVDAELLDLCRQWREKNEAINAVWRSPGNDPAAEELAGRLCAELWPLFDRITTTTPKTLIGLAGQAAIVRDQLLLMHTDATGKVSWGDHDARAAYLVLAHIEGLAKAPTG